MNTNKVFHMCTLCHVLIKLDQRAVAPVMSTKSARCDVLEALRAETFAAINARLCAPAGPLRLAGAKSSECALDAHVALKSPPSERVRKTTGPTAPAELCSSPSAMPCGIVRCRNCL